MSNVAGALSNTYNQFSTFIRTIPGRLSTSLTNIQGLAAANPVTAMAISIIFTGGLCYATFYIAEKAHSLTENELVNSFAKRFTLLSGFLASALLIGAFNPISWPAALVIAAVVFIVAGTVFDFIRSKKIEKPEDEIIKKDEEIIKKDEEIIKKDEEIIKKDEEIIKKDEEIIKKDEEIIKKDGKSE